MHAFRLGGSLALPVLKRLLEKKVPNRYDSRRDRRLGEVTEWPNVPVSKFNPVATGKHRKPLVL